MYEEYVKQQRLPQSDSMSLGQAKIHYNSFFSRISGQAKRPLNGNLIFVFHNAERASHERPYRVLTILLPLTLCIKHNIYRHNYKFKLQNTACQVKHRAFQCGA